MKIKLIIMCLSVTINIGAFTNIGLASTLNENLPNDTLTTYYVNDENEKITTLNLIKANMDSKVKIVYSGNTVPKSKKNLKFYYSKDTFNSFYKYQNSVSGYLYNLGAYEGFGIEDATYDSKNNTIEVIYNFYYYDTMEQSEYISEVINNAIKKDISKLKTDYQKLQWAYDWVIDNVYYDKSLNNFSVYSGLTESGTVCVGYATLYSTLVNKLGLDCRVVEGSVYNNKGNNHVWNIVKLDGIWYGVDVTWGDGVKNKDDYFLRSIYTLALDEYGNHNSNVYEEYTLSGEKFSDIDYTQVCDYIINPISLSVYNVKIDVLKTIILDVGENYNFLIDNPDNIELKFKSSNLNVADIDVNGNITGYEKGITVITIFNEDLNISQSCNIIVK